MIYLFMGTDVPGVRGKASQWLAAARAKAPDASTVRLDPSAITTHALHEALGAQGLFFQKSLVVLDDPLSRAESKEATFTLLQELAATPNIVCIIAPGKEKELTRIATLATKTFTVDAPVPRPRGFNSALVNALAQRKGVLLWTELNKAYALGDAPEQLHGLLHWKARELLRTPSKVWSREEARALSKNLIALLAESRSGGLTLTESLERFALTLS
jgi:hypothetical protein